MSKKVVHGFDFIQIGSFYKNETPLNVRYNNKDSKVWVSLKLADEKFKQIKKSTYLIYVDDKLMYVGSYSNTLEHRWIKKGEYIWHHKDIQIQEKLEEGKMVSLWILENPEFELKDCHRLPLNISRSLEQEIIDKNKPLWNRRC